MCSSGWRSVSERLIEELERLGAGGATHFVTTMLPKVAAEMALSVLAYNLMRVMNVIRN